MWLCISRSPSLHLHHCRNVCRRLSAASALLSGNHLHILSLNYHRSSATVRWWCTVTSAVSPRSPIKCAVGRYRLGVFLQPTRTVVLGAQFPPLPPIDELKKKHASLRRVFKSRIKNKYIIDSELAAVVVDHLGHLSESKQWIFELNPGPGIVTRELLAAGANRILVLENDRLFLPYTTELAKCVGDRLQVKYADFFRVDPLGEGDIKQPAISSHELFSNIQPAHWKEEPIARVVGMLSQEKEKTHLRQLCNRILERSSLFEFGRLQLNLFTSEKTYNMITAPPSVDLVAYTSTSIMCQVCFDIELLLKEPHSKFVPVQVKGHTVYKLQANANRFVNDHMCLVRLTPKPTLFDHGLTPQNASKFIFLVRQLMAKPRANLADRMEIWVPGNLKILSELGFQPNMRAGDLSPHQLMKIFLLLLEYEGFKNTWWEDEAYEQINSINSHHVG